MVTYRFDQQDNTLVLFLKGLPNRVSASGKPVQNQLHRSSVSCNVLVFNSVSLTSSVIRASLIRGGSLRETRPPPVIDREIYLSEQLVTIVWREIELS